MVLKSYIVIAVSSTIGAAILLADDRADNRNALRQIVQEQCVPNWQGRHIPAPCQRVLLSGTPDKNDGFAVLADRKGGAHFLLIPTQTVSGIESPELLMPGATNYFAAAWLARDVVEAKFGQPLSRAAIGLAVNSKLARGQDQLHIHMECLRTDVAEALSANAEQLGDTWTPIDIAGSKYQAMRVMGEELQQHNPFELLANHLPDSAGTMDAFTLIVAGMKFKQGPGFAVVAGRDVPSGELLLDSTCAVAVRRVAPYP